MSVDLNNGMASPEVEGDLGFEIPDEIEPSADLLRDYLLSVVTDCDLSMIEDVPHFTEVEEDSTLSLVTGQILELQRENLQNFEPEDGFKDGDLRLHIHNAIKQAREESADIALRQGNDASQDVQDVFNFMLDKAANLRGPKSGKRPYQEFLADMDHEDLWNFLVRSADPEIWTKVILAGETQNFDVLDSLPSVPLPREGGWYIAILKKKLANSRWYRGYAGQAVGFGGVQQRVKKEHEVNVLNSQKTSLFMRFWRGDVDVSDESVQSLDDLPHDCKFVCVGTDRSGLQGDNKSLFVNIAEMFFALIFRFLQTASLQDWLPPGFSLPTEPIGCNVALPLWQCDNDAAKRSFTLLLRSDDPKVREYARSRILPGLAKARALRWVGDVDNTNIALAGQAKSQAKAAQKGKQVYWRQPDQSLGDAPTVKVRCNACSAETVDTSPTYVIPDGRYVVRTMACTGSCKPSEAMMKHQRIRSKRTLHSPVPSSPYSGQKRSILASSVRRQIEKNGRVTPI